MGVIRRGRGTSTPPPLLKVGGHHIVCPPPTLFRNSKHENKKLFSGGLNKMEFKNNKDIKYAVFRSLYVVKMSARASRPHYLQQNEGKGALNAMFSSQ